MRLISKFWIFILLALCCWQDCGAQDPPKNQTGTRRKLVRKKPGATKPTTIGTTPAVTPPADQTTAAPGEPTNTMPTLPLDATTSSPQQPDKTTRTPEATTASPESTIGILPMDYGKNPCHQELEKLANSVQADGSIRPNCTSKGWYNHTQCDRSSCWCVFPDSGKELENTRTPLDSKPSCPACLMKQAESLPAPGIVGAYAPGCDKQGNFEVQQFWGSTGYSWCVDTITGNEIEGTKTPPGKGPLDCSKHVNSSQSDHNKENKSGGSKESPKDKESKQRPKNKEPDEKFWGKSSENNDTSFNFSHSGDFGALCVVLCFGNASESGHEMNSSAGGDAMESPFSILDAMTDPAKLEKSCKKYKEMQSCIDRCPPSKFTQLMMKPLTIKKFACIDHYDDVRKHATCLNNVTQTLSDICNQTCSPYMKALTNGAAGFRRHPRSAEADYDDNGSDMFHKLAGVNNILNDTCNLIACYDQCMRGNVTEQCGEDAIALVDKFDNVAVSCALDMASITQFISRSSSEFPPPACKKYAGNMTANPMAMLGDMFDGMLGKMSHGSLNLDKIINGTHGFMEKGGFDLGKLMNGTHHFMGEMGEDGFDLGKLMNGTDDFMGKIAAFNFSTLEAKIENAMAEKIGSFFNNSEWMDKIGNVFNASTMGDTFDSLNPRPLVDDTVNAVNESGFVDEAKSAISETKETVTNTLSEAKENVMSGISSLLDGN